MDQKSAGYEFSVPLCRLRHPKRNIDKTEFLLAFPQDVDENELMESKKDYKKIRKYLTHGDNYKQSDKIETFSAINNLTIYKLEIYSWIFMEKMLKLCMMPMMLKM